MNFDINNSPFQEREERRRKVISSYNEEFGRKYSRLSDEIPESVAKRISRILDNISN